MIFRTIEDFSPEAIADSGQCFRMRAQPDGVRLIACGRWLKITPAEGGFWFSCTDEEFETVWRPYFDLDADYAAYRARILKRDKFLQCAAEYGAGLRILRQEPFEMLVSFIISQRKSIPAIRTAVEALCTRFGSPLDTPEGTAYAFPTPPQLAAASPEELAACGLGYRAPYVQDAARRTADGTLDLAALAELSDEQLLEQLQTVCGVGVKVASCTALFAYHRLGALPVDVWIERVLRQVYGGQWPRRYQPCAGVLQQYIFYYARCPACDFLCG